MNPDQNSQNDYRSVSPQQEIVGPDLPQVQPTNLNLEQNRAVGDNSTENPYTIEYLQKIAPQEKPTFWTKGKIFLAVFVVLAVMLSAWMIAITSGKNDSSDQRVIKAYYRLMNMKEISNNFQKKLQKSDLAAINAGLSKTLASSEQDFLEYIKSTNIDIPKNNKNPISESVKEEYKELNQTLEDAFLNASLDDTYTREFTYNLHTLKTYISDTKSRRSGKKSREVLTKAIDNLSAAIKQFEDQSKRTSL